MGLFLEVKDINSEELCSYPIDYLRAVSNVLNCEIEDLRLITNISDEEDLWIETWSHDDLEEVMRAVTITDLEILKDDYEIAIGHIQHLTVDDIHLVSEQNASPMGFWIDVNQIDELKSKAKDE